MLEKFIDKMTDEEIHELCMDLGVFLKMAKEAKTFHQVSEIRKHTQEELNKLQKGLINKH